MVLPGCVSRYLHGALSIHRGPCLSSCRMGVFLVSTNPGLVSEHSAASWGLWLGYRTCRPPGKVSVKSPCGPRPKSLGPWGTSVTPGPSGYNVLPEQNGSIRPPRGPGVSDATWRQAGECHASSRTGSRGHSRTACRELTPHLAGASPLDSAS